MMVELVEFIMGLFSEKVVNIAPHENVSKPENCYHPNPYHPDGCPYANIDYSDGNSKSVSMHMCTPECGWYTD